MLFSFPSEGNSHLGPRSACLRDGVMWAKGTVLPTLFCVVIYMFSAPLNGLLTSPRAIFVHRSLSNCCSLWGDGGWDPLLHHLGGVLLKLQSM